MLKHTLLRKNFTSLAAVMRVATSLLCPTLRCVPSSSELEVSFGHQGLRSRTQGIKASVGRREERTATTTVINRAVASARMSNRMLNMAVGKWLQCRTRKLQGLQVAVGGRDPMLDHQVR